MRTLQYAIKKSISKQDGVTLVEILVGLALLAMVVAPFLNNFLKSVEIGRLSKEILFAEYIAQIAVEQIKQEPPDVDDVTQGWQTEYAEAAVQPITKAIAEYDAAVKMGKIPNDPNSGMPQQYLKTYELYDNDVYIEVEIIDKKTARNLGTADKPNVLEVEPEMPDVDYVMIPHKSRYGQLLIDIWKYDGTPIELDKTINRCVSVLMDNNPPDESTSSYEFSCYFYNSKKRPRKKYVLGSNAWFVTPESVTISDLRKGHSSRPSISSNEWEKITDDDDISVYIDGHYAVEEFGLGSDDASVPNPFIKFRFSVDDSYASELPKKTFTVYENDVTNSFEIGVDERLNRGTVDFVRGYITNPESQDDINNSNNYYWVVVNVYKNSDKKVLLATADTSIRKK